MRTAATGSRMSVDSLMDRKTTVAMKMTTQTLDARPRMSSEACTARAYRRTSAHRSVAIEMPLG